MKKQKFLVMGADSILGNLSKKICHTLRGFELSEPNISIIMTSLLPVADRSGLSDTDPLCGKANRVAVKLL